MKSGTPQGSEAPRCRASGCRARACAMGLCSRHYQQMRRHGRLTPEREYRARGKVCIVEGCGNPQIARGLCYRHYQQVRRHGRLTPEREHRVRQMERTANSKQRSNKPRSNT